MDYYSPIKGISSVEKAIDELREVLRNYPKSDVAGNAYLRDWTDLYRIGVDGIIVNIGYQLILRGKGSYSRWCKEMKSSLSFLQQYGINDKSLDEVIVKSRSVLFKESAKETMQPLSAIAHRQEPFLQRVFNNKIVNALCSIIVCLFPFLVETECSIYCVVANSMIMIAMIIGKKPWWAIPIATCAADLIICAICGAFVDETRELVTASLFSLIMFIPFYLNSERVKEPASGVY